MKPILAACLTITVAMSAGCMQSQPMAEECRRQEEVCLRTLVQNISPTERQSILLSATNVVRLDAQTLLLVGSFRSAAGSMRTAIFRSPDNGRTWQPGELWVAGCTVCDVFVLDAQHAWVAVCWDIQGRLPPYFFLATQDGGRTWRRSSQNLTPSEGTPLLDHWSFADANNGNLSFLCDDELITYLTSDGGQTWSPAGKKRAYRSLVPAPSVARGSLRVSVDPIADVLSVEECLDPGHWRELGRLPHVWRLTDVTLDPVK